MKKLRGSLVTCPANENVIEQESPFCMSQNNGNVHCKLLLANGANVLDIIERERTELSCQLADEENSSEKCFIEQAIELLSEREKFVLSQVESISKRNSKETNDSKGTSDSKSEGPSDLKTEETKDSKSQMTSDSKFENLVGNIQTLDLNDKRERYESESIDASKSEELHVQVEEAASGPSSSKFFYFYQGNLLFFCSFSI